MADPRPSWEVLITALKQPSIGHADLAVAVEKELGINDEGCDERSGKYICVHALIPV